MTRPMPLRAVMALVVMSLALGAATTGAMEPSNNGTRLASEPANTSASGSDLDRGFREPPNAARLRVYWWWLNSNVTRESITEDLEQMQRQGIGGALLFDTDNENFRKNRLATHGPDFGGPEYRALFAHMLKEADRLGIEISFQAQSGWNLGGPSVTPEEASKLVTWSETIVSGNQKLDTMLPQPKSYKDFYRDIAVLAYRHSQRAEENGESVRFEVSANWNEAGHTASSAVDGDPKSYWCTDGHQPGDGPRPDRPDWINMKFTRPVTATSLVVIGRKGYGPKKCELQVAQGDHNFHKVKEFTMVDRKDAIVRFDPVEGDEFRLVVYESYDVSSPGETRHVAIQEMALRGEKQAWPERKNSQRPIRDLPLKTSSRELTPDAAPDSSHLLTDEAAQPNEVETKLADVVDLTSKVDADGRLKWDAPAGEWQVIRFGYTNSDAKVVNGSGGWGGRVLDHLDAGALRSYWKQTVAPFLDDPAIAPYVGKSWKYVHSDSWEMGGMNWTKDFGEQFQKRRGYDPTRFFPALAGHIVESRDVTNRFLNDYRRTIAECVAENHYRTFTELAHANKLLTHCEAGGPHGAPVDALESLGHSDVPMMEFWAKAKTHRVADVERFFVKEAASAAHIYGKNLVAAEGETTVGTHWEESFRDNLKPTFDRAVCEGLNRLVFHQFTSSPKAEGLPGQEYFAGTHFSPRVTWWPLVHGWTSYVNRCQFMMQQGQFVADVCYYNGDNIPNMEAMKDIDPAGILPEYDYDVINQDVLLHRLVVNNGRLELPSGMSYRLLVLPKHGFISLEALRKVAELVEAGATVVGPKPTALTGLREYPACDQELAKITSAVWGDCDGRAVTRHAHGSGQVFWGPPTKEVLATLKAPADFEAQCANKELKLDYIHRRADGVDIYFIANRGDQAGLAECTFRVADRAPEIFDPFSGETRRDLLYQTTEVGHVVAPLYFAANDSAIVVFRSPAGRRIVALAKDGTALFPAQGNGPAAAPIQVSASGESDFSMGGSPPGKYELKDDTGKTYSITVAEPATRTIDGDWTVRFAPGWGAPESVTFDKLQSWTESDDPNVKYFSGMATYEKEIDIPAELIGAGRRLTLDLGDLAEMADVTLNGQPLGVLWRPPFTVDITSAAKAGANKLEVRVVNHWRNRLIGDAKLPTAERRTKTNIIKYEKGEFEPLPSGLLGPVTIRGEAVERRSFDR